MTTLQNSFLGLCMCSITHAQLPHKHFITILTSLGKAIQMTSESSGYRDTVKWCLVYLEH